MRFSFNKNKPLCRALICFLCALILVGFFCRPVANASALAGAIELGLSTGEVMAVLPEYALIIFLLIGAGWVVDNLDDVYEAAVQLFDSNPYVYRWSKSYSTYDFASLNQLYYDEETRLAVNDYLAVQNLPGLPPDDDDHKYYLSVPTSLLMLDTLQSSTIIMYDKATLSAVLNNTQLINANTALTTANNGMLTTLTAKADTMLLEIAGAGAALGAMSTKLENKLTTINTTIGDMRSSLVYRIENISTVVVNTRTALQTAIQEQTSSIAYRLDYIPVKLDSLWTRTYAGITPAFHQDLTNAELAEIVLNNQNENGKKYHLPLFLKRGEDTLTYYATPILASSAVLSKFFDIPVISDLVQFSLALGIFALLVNLGNTIVSKDNNNAVKGKHSKTGKAKTGKGG